VEAFSGLRRPFRSLIKFSQCDDPHVFLFGLRLYSHVGGTYCFKEAMPSSHAFSPSQELFINNFLFRGDVEGDLRRPRFSPQITRNLSLCLGVLLSLNIPDVPPLSVSPPSILASDISPLPTLMWGNFKGYGLWALLSLSGRPPPPFSMMPSVMYLVHRIFPAPL